MTTNVGDNRLQRLPKDIAVFSLVADAENEHFLLKVFARAKFPQTLWNTCSIGLSGLIAPTRFCAVSRATPTTLSHAGYLGVYHVQESLNN